MKFRFASLALIFVLMLGITSVFAQEEDDSQAIIIENSAFFPESVAIYDGILYTSDFATAEIVAINLEDGTNSVFAPAEEGKAGWGLYVDEATGVLLSCVAGLGEPFGGVAPTTPNDVRAYSLETGEILASWTLEAGIVCNSITVGGDNTIFMSDIVTPQIIKLDTETGESSVWSADPAYVVEGGFGISGLVFDGENSLYAVANGKLFRVGIAEDGSAEAAVEITLTDANGEATALATDGLVWVGDGVMVGGENDVFAPGANGRALRVTLGEDNTAVVDAIAEGLSDPSAVTVMWDEAEMPIVVVANSFMGYLFGVDEGDKPASNFITVELGE